MKIAMSSIQNLSQSDIQVVSGGVFGVEINLERVAAGLTLAWIANEVRRLYETESHQVKCIMGSTVEGAVGGLLIAPVVGPAASAAVRG